MSHQGQKDAADVMKALCGIAATGAVVVGVLSTACSCAQPDRRAPPARAGVAGQKPPAGEEIQGELPHQLQPGWDHRPEVPQEDQRGGAARWQDKAAIGFYGVEQAPAIITQLDANRPIYDEARCDFDAFISYRTKFLSNRISATFQVNVRNLNEGGRLQPIAAGPDGNPTAYRIVDPRQFIFTATFEL